MIGGIFGLSLIVFAKGDSAQRMDQINGGLVVTLTAVFCLVVRHFMMNSVILDDRGIIVRRTRLLGQQVDQVSYSEIAEVEFHLLSKDLTLHLKDGRLIRIPAGSSPANQVLDLGSSFQSKLEAEMKIMENFIRAHL